MEQNELPLGEKYREAKTLHSRSTSVFTRCFESTAPEEFRNTIPLWEETVAELAYRVAFQARTAARLLQNSFRSDTDSIVAMEPANAKRICRSGATVPPHAILNFVRHSTVHLEVELRELSSARLTRPFMTVGDRDFSIIDFLRTRSVGLWKAQHAIGQGLRSEQLPQEILQIEKELAIDDFLPAPYSPHLLNG